jgi:predicted nuclease with RNAse H fold
VAAWVGIDLAAQDENTALCVLEEDRLTVRDGVGDAALLAAMRGARAVGIDAPFGWPRTFADELARYAAGGPWEAAGPELRLRATDRAVTEWARARGQALFPLSVSSDRIAVCAWRCARLLTAHGMADRAGADGVAEVYPAAALLAWGLPSRGYKRVAPGGAEVRERIVAGLELRFSLSLGDRDLVAHRRADDRLDAVVCALLAREVAHGRTLRPPPEHAEAARAEGWIHVPAD